MQPVFGRVLHSERDSVLPVQKCDVRRQMWHKAMMIKLYFMHEVWLKNILNFIRSWKEKIKDEEFLFFIFNRRQFTGLPFQGTSLVWTSLLQAGCSFKCSSVIFKIKSEHLNDTIVLTLGFLGFLFWTFWGNVWKIRCEVHKVMYDTSFAINTILSYHRYQNLLLWTQHGPYLGVWPPNLGLDSVPPVLVPLYHRKRIIQRVLPGFIALSSFELV